MTIVLGFGRTEQDVEQQIERLIRDEVKSRCQSQGYGDYFTGEFAREIGTWVDGLAESSRATAAAYRHSEDHPDRYSSFWAHTIDDANYLVFILEFHHISRRHALSPDGWALFQSERVFYIRHGEQVT